MCPVNRSMNTIACSVASNWHILTITVCRDCLSVSKLPTAKEILSTGEPLDWQILADIDVIRPKASAHYCCVLVSDSRAGKKEESECRHQSASFLPWPACLPLFPGTKYVMMMMEWCCWSYVYSRYHWSSTASSRTIVWSLVPFDKRFPTVSSFLSIQDPAVPILIIISLTKTQKIGVEDEWKDLIRS